MNPVIDTAIKDLITKTSVQIDEIQVIVDEETGSVWYHIKTPESHLLLGRDGETLTALNHIARKMIEKIVGEQGSSLEFFIDVNNFQKKKIDSLKAIAHMMSERARFFKSSVEVDPMSAYDRKIIHMCLQNKSDLQTESKGEGKDRRVVITYIGQI